jgi:uncharacterized repeat protein (TIGR01451 family)
MQKNSSINLKPGLAVILAILMLTMALAAVTGLARPVLAQEPLPPTPSLADFGLDPDTVVAAGVEHDLQVSKKAAKTSVVSGQAITFTITITNSGSNPVSLVQFEDNYPAQMKQVAFLFSTTAISNGQAKPKWMLPGPIPAGSKVVVTVTGILTSAPNITVTNVASATAWDASGETNTANNRSSVPVGIAGYSPSKYVYLPLIFKAPPPPPITEVYYESFNSGKPWFEFRSNGCTTKHEGGRYWVDLTQNSNSCLPPAKNEQKPDYPYRTYGEFEVLGYHSEGVSNAPYGIFINGTGGDNYYLFRIWPNNSCSSGGDWNLIRRKSGNSTTLVSGSCNTAIKRGSEINTLRIAHSSNGTLTVMVNGATLGTYNDSGANHLTGTANGVYVGSSSSKDIRIKFDDFRVFKYN